MELFDIAVAKKLSGGGGTPVTTRTVEGTLKNPFGDIGFTLVRDALKNNVGSAVMQVTMGTQKATVPLMYVNGRVLFNGIAFNGIATSNLSQFTAYIAMWLENGGGDIAQFSVINGKSDSTWNVDNYTSLAKNFPTTLTFTYWGD